MTGHTPRRWANCGCGAHADKLPPEPHAYQPDHLDPGCYYCGRPADEHQTTPEARIGRALARMAPSTTEPMPYPGAELPDLDENPTTAELNAELDPDIDPRARLCPRYGASCPYGGPGRRVMSCRCGAPLTPELPAPGARLTETDPIHRQPHDHEPDDDGTCCRWCGMPADPAGPASIGADALALLAADAARDRDAEADRWTDALAQSTARAAYVRWWGRLTRDELATAAARFGIVADGRALPLNALHEPARDLIRHAHHEPERRHDEARTAEARARQRELGDVWAGIVAARAGKTTHEARPYEASDAFDERTRWTFGTASQRARLPYHALGAELLGGAVGPAYPTR